MGDLLVLEQEDIPHVYMVGWDVNCIQPQILRARLWRPTQLMSARSQVRIAAYALRISVLRPYLKDRAPGYEGDGVLSFPGMTNNDALLEGFRCLIFRIDSRTDLRHMAPKQEWGSTPNLSGSLKVKPFGGLQLSGLVQHYDVTHLL